MEVKLKGDSTYKATVTEEYGETKEYTDKIPIEKLIADENEAKYHQTEGGSQLLTKPFLKNLGEFGNGPEVINMLNGSYVPPTSSSLTIKSFLDECKFNDEARNMAKHDNITTRYKEQVKLWTIRKENPCSYHQYIGHFKAIFKDKYLSWFSSREQIFPQYQNIHYLDTESV